VLDELVLGVLGVLAGVLEAELSEDLVAVAAAGVVGVVAEPVLLFLLSRESLR
jgi:hypothetical protein